MSESERSESYGTPMSSDEAAELEELRREAAVLREQLESAVGPQSGLRSARDVHQLEARIDSLAARNSKLMETLKEARQQLLLILPSVGHRFGTQLILFDLRLYHVGDLAALNGDMNDLINFGPDLAIDLMMPENTQREMHRKREECLQDLLHLDG